MDDSTDSLTLYADYACPFCYLEHRSIARYREQRPGPLELTWRPYDIRNERRRADGTLPEREARNYPVPVVESIGRLRGRLDAEEMLDPEAVPYVDSLNAQVASLWVDRTSPERWVRFDDAVFEALWRDGRDVGRVDVLSDLAEDVGVDGDEIRTAVADETRRDHVLDAFADGRRDGIEDVPTLVSGNRTAREVLSVDALREFVESD